MNDSWELSDFIRSLGLMAETQRVYCKMLIANGFSSAEALKLTGMLVSAAFSAEANQRKGCDTE